ncbi:hypothetical protein INR49_027699 [Caranx melampygus]|nr:hypothetical protein INR49_027699 [Caranx melampygus]
MLPAPVAAKVAVVGVPLCFSLGLVLRYDKLFFRAARKNKRKEKYESLGRGGRPFSFPSSDCKMVDISFPLCPVMFAMSFPRPAPVDSECHSSAPEIGSSFGGRSSSEDVDESELRLSRFRFRLFLLRSTL